jgi:putative aldouronate transport system permease protein
MADATLNRAKKYSAFDVIDSVLMCLIALTILYPFYNAIITSFMTDKAYVASKFGLFPSEVTLGAYNVLFRDGFIFTAYRNSLFIVITGLVYSMMITVLCAYAFSQKKFPGKSFLFSIFIFTMFLGGGLIPFYILIKNLGLMNSLWAIVLPSGMSVFYMLLTKYYFESLPESISESAKLDGAGELTILTKIILPVSMPIIATIALFTIVDFWNSWFTAMLFIKTADKKPLQLWLREMIFAQNTRISVMLIDSMIRVKGQSVQMAAVLVTMLPVMCIYPFLQKYFVKGIMIGAIKG